MNIELINKENNLSITMDSFIGDTGVLVTLFEDEQIQGEFNKFKGVNQSGMSISSTTLSERTINVEGFILANSRDQIMEMRRQLIRVLNPKDDVLLKYKEDNINRAITIRAESIPIFSSDYKTNNDNALAFKCFLNAPYPFWQEIEGKKAEIVMWKGDFHFPLVIPKNKGIIMGHREPSLIVNVINNGDVETGMTIEFFARGTLKNPSLFNVNT
ncbi:phage tail domain-containing protein, partial [Clostridium sp.]|uniref:phage tail domain-containing protein n=1 Tax=Clostridium sp. TaxID=1506 RepID=UPI0034648B11